MMDSSNQTNAGSRKRRIVRGFFRFLRGAVALVILYVAVCGISWYIEQQNVPKPIVSIPRWREYAYNDPGNPLAHYEIAVRLASRDDVDTAMNEILQGHYTPAALSALARLRPAFEELHKGASLPAANLVFPDPALTDSLGQSATEIACSRISALWWHFVPTLRRKSWMERQTKESPNSSTA